MDIIIILSIIFGFILTEMIFFGMGRSAKYNDELWANKALSICLGTFFGGIFFYVSVALRNSNLPFAQILKYGLLTGLAIMIIVVFGITNYAIAKKVFKTKPRLKEVY